MVHQDSSKLWLGTALTFMTVTCVTGLNEVSPELQNLFRNLSNDIPLSTLQAMFNESRITLYSGYHLDHFWNADEHIIHETRNSTSNGYRYDSSQDSQSTPNEYSETEQ